MNDVVLERDDDEIIRRPIKLQLSNDPPLRCHSFRNSEQKLMRCYCITRSKLDAIRIAMICSLENLYVVQRCAPLKIPAAARPMHAYPQ